MSNLTISAPTFRRLPRDPGWVRYDPYETQHDGTVLITVHVAHGQDKSPRWDTLNHYEPTCGWCWLGYTHSEAAHQADLPASA
jgi:hypothetical protein